ncbi:tetratricopeptide repeat protein [Rickettsia endosymbiont of Ceutorhynchus obstrictus]|uniref:tetratricopeptide repeat protein n=1 Tax=Rickettsia endosymbiont of Ceutorhynchus obstrictus TaxID=3066249 RepID=UPI003132D0A5
MGEEMKNHITEEETNYFNQGYALYNLGKYEEAVVAFDKAIELENQDIMGTAYMCKGVALSLAEKEDMALLAYEKAISKCCAGVYYCKGLLLFNSGELDEALLAYESEEKRKHSHLNVLSNIMDDTKKANEHDDRRIKEIDEKLKAPLNENVKKDLEQEKQEYQQRKEERNKALNKRLEPINKKIDEEREALLKLAEKSPDFAKAKIEKHIEQYDKQYKAQIENNPDYQELKKLQEIIKKVEPQTELGTAKRNIPPPLSSTKVENEDTSKNIKDQPSKNSNHEVIKVKNKPNSSIAENLLKGKINGKISDEAVKVMEWTSLYTESITVVIVLE